MITIRCLYRGYARMSLHNTREIVKPVEQDPRFLKVAIIGMPNAGKSTLINQLLQLEVCPVSKRVHTTRQSQKAIFLRDNTQVVFVDTPGVVNTKEIKKFQFSEDFSSGPTTAIQDADVVGVIHDISNRLVRHKLDPRVVNVLEQFPEKDTILILNKVDTVKFKRSLLDAVRFLTNSTVGGKPIAVKFPKRNKPLSMDEILAKARTKRDKLESKVDDFDTLPDHDALDITNSNEFEVNGWGGFNDVFMISALSGDGVNLLEDYFVANARSSGWEFSEDVLTDCPPMELTLKILKAKLLEYLPQELPYSIRPSLDFWEESEDSGKLRIVLGVYCPKERFAKMVVGSNGSIITEITIAVEKDLVKLLQKEIDLHIKVSAPEKKVKVATS